MNEDLLPFLTPVIYWEARLQLQLDLVLTCFFFFFPPYLKASCSQPVIIAAYWTVPLRLHESMLLFLFS